MVITVVTIIVFGTNNYPKSNCIKLCTKNGDIFLKLAVLDSISVFKKKTIATALNGKRFRVLEPTVFNCRCVIITISGLVSVLPLLFRESEPFVAASV